MAINFMRIGLAAVAAFAAYMTIGALMFVALPRIRDEFSKYPGVYRDHDGQMRHMPVGMAGLFIAMVALCLLYARLPHIGSGATDGALFGVLVAVFVVGAFVLHNHANLNIGRTLTAFSAIAYFVEWLVAGIVIGLVYRPM